MESTISRNAQKTTAEKKLLQPDLLSSVLTGHTASVAQDAKELQRVSRLKDQLGSQVAKLKAQIATHQDMTDEVNAARQALAAKDAELQQAHGFAQEHEQLLSLLSKWTSSPEGILLL